MVELLRNLAEHRTPYVINQNGEAKAVVIDIVSYEEAQKTFALPKLAGVGRGNAREGRVRLACDTLAKLRLRTRDGE